MGRRLGSAASHPARAIIDNARNATEGVPYRTYVMRKKTMRARLLRGYRTRLVALIGVSFSLFAAGREAQGGEPAAGSSAVCAPQGRTPVAYRPRLFGRRFYSSAAQSPA